MTIKFKFNLQKAIEVTANLRKMHGSSILVTELHQMLYLIDRCSIRDTNYPIIGGNYVKHHKAIVIEEVYLCIKSPKIIRWKEHISYNSEENSLDLIVDPGNQNLSEREEEQIRFIYETIRYLELGTSTFNFPEWEGLYNYSTLNVVKLLKVLEKTDEEIEEIRSISLREDYLDQLLGEN